MESYSSYRSYWIAFILALMGITDCVQATYNPAPSSREKLNFNLDWKFIREDVSGAEKPDFDDSSWQDVGLPHTYNDQDTFDKMPDPKKGDGGWDGKTWYRKHFTIDAKYASQKVYIEFEAARTVAKVWINGTFLGQYTSGFSSFAFDLTPYLAFGKPNVLAVQVDDTEGQDIAAGNSSHWNPVLGGLYRPVWLYITDKVHVTFPLYSFLKTEGTYVGATNITQGSSDFRMTTEVQNNTDSDQACELTTDVVSAEGAVVLTLQESHDIPAGSLYKFDQSGKIAKPLLWSLEDPFLYTVYSTVRSGARVKDVYTTPFGIREFHFDGDKSRFIFNGDELILRGWGQKPNNSFPGLGSALPDWLLESDMKMMKEGGGNIVRWGHCSGPIASLDEGDKIGYFNWQANLSGESDYKGAVWDNKMDELRDILIRDRNHPSIVIWEGNNTDVSLEHTQQIKDIIHKWDWITPRPFANRGPYRPETEELQDFSMEMDGSKDYIPSGKAHLEAEYNRAEIARSNWDADSPPPAGVGYWWTTPTKNWRTEVLGMEGIVNQWKGVKARGGGVKWHFTDDTTHIRTAGPMARLSGSLDATRLPKDIYYGLKVLYRDDPQIHIMGHWNYDKPHTVVVYSNCDEIELMVNDQSLGKKPVKDWSASWPDVPFTPGVLKAVGYNGGSPDCNDERVTAGSPAKIVLDVITDPKGLRADRSDVALITATLEDKDGNPNPIAQNAITFAVSGPGNYRGGYNDYLPDTTGKNTLFAEAGKIRVSLRSTNVPGTITVTATSDGLESGKVEVNSLPVEAPVGITSKTTGQ